MDIPEIVTRTLGHLELRDRELTRRVCHAWDSIASGLRGLLEVEAYPVSREFTHLGVAVRDPRYLKYVETQEDFDRLWHFYRHGILPNPRFVTQDVLKAMDYYRTSYSQERRAYRWFIRLDYETMETIDYKGTFFQTYTIADELARQSRLGILDPRKVWLVLRIWGVYLCDRMPGTHHLSDTWNSQLLLTASVCPEIALYYWLFYKKCLLPKDATLGPSLIGTELYEVLRTPCDMKCTGMAEFVNLCRTLCLRPAND